MDLTTYATLSAELANSADTRDEVLARHGLDEASWGTIEEAWQARLSEAMDIDDEGRIPALLSEFSTAYAQAQQRFAAPVTLEQFAEVTRLLGSTSDIYAVLRSVGISLADYVQASETWNRRIATEPALEQRFHAAIDGSPPLADAGKAHR